MDSLQTRLSQFKAELFTIPLEEVVRTYVFEGIPFVFHEQPAHFDLLRKHLCRQLRVERDNVFVVGSAKVGFSLSPDTFPRRFSDRSDIDVAIVDKTLFDEGWNALLRWSYPRRSTGLPKRERGWSRSRRDDIFWGWLNPHRIRFQGLSFPEVLNPLRELSTKWFNAFRTLSHYEPFFGRDISGRLYRSRNHALLYQADALRQIREVIRGSLNRT